MQLPIQSYTQLEATQLWCDITNKLIKRYKLMSENDPEKAIKELSIISKFCEENHFLDEVDYN